MTRETHTRVLFCQHSHKGSHPQCKQAETSAVTTLDWRLSKDFSDALQGQLVWLTIQFCEGCHRVGVRIPAVAVYQQGILQLEMVHQDLELEPLSSVSRQKILEC